MTANNRENQEQMIAHTTSDGTVINQSPGSIPYMEFNGTGNIVNRLEDYSSSYPGGIHPDPHAAPQDNTHFANNPHVIHQVGAYCIGKVVHQGTGRIHINPHGDIGAVNPQTNHRIFQSEPGSIRVVNYGDPTQFVIYPTPNSAAHQSRLGRSYQPRRQPPRSKRSDQSPRRRQPSSLVQRLLKLLKQLMD